LRANERGEDTGQLNQRRQELRDLPQTVDLEGISTPEDLKDVWPF